MIYLLLIALSLNIMSCAKAELPKEWDKNPEKKLVIAHYMTWFRNAEESGDWNYWRWTGNGPWHYPDRALEKGKRDIASVFYPVIGPYDSLSEDVIEYHILLAKASKIQGFVVDWYGESSKEDAGFELLMKMCRKLDFSAGICFEDKAMFGYKYRAKSRKEALNNAKKEMKYLLEKYASKKEYLNLFGRPVITNFSWSEPGKGIRNDGFSEKEYKKILSAVRNFTPVFIHDYHPHVKEKYHDLPDSLYPWIDSWQDLERFFSLSKKLLKEKRINFITGLAYPGFDNTGCWGWGGGPFIRPRENGRTFEQSWKLSSDNNSRVIQLLTFNDWCEGAVIEPSLEFGYKYLKMNEEFAAKFLDIKSDGGKGLAYPERIYKARQLLKRTGYYAADNETEKFSIRIDSAVSFFVSGNYAATDELLKGIEKELLKKRVQIEGKIKKASASISLTEKPEGQGLLLKEPLKEKVSKASFRKGRQCREIATNIFFKLSDKIRFSPDRNNRIPCKISFSYLDSGKDLIGLNADTGKGDAFRTIGIIKKKDTGKWVDASFIVLLDGGFGGRQNDSADFKISSANDGNEWVSNVSIEELFWWEF